jgi:hypothetical protein
MERRKLNKGKLDLAFQTQSLVKDTTSKEKVSLIVKVNKPGYVPEGFDVRTRINDYIFTADSSPATLQLHEHNQNIESISPSIRLKMIK